MAAKRRKPGDWKSIAAQTVGDHQSQIVVDKPLKCGHYLSWRCPGCDARGSCTMSTRDKALSLFSMIAEAHAAAQHPTEEWKDQIRA